ncbi:MAG TPA: hypothetical protein VG939_15565 [Caulobacteraceae bacterium]|nr:hypothetical protein [Caulobacteraceae bacterium]
MLIKLALPRILEPMTSAEVIAVHAREGEALRIGGRLVDLKIDLGAALAHDCPPISYYRIALREAAWLRRLPLNVGDSVAPGDLVALFSTTADEPLEGEPARSARVTVAGLVVDTALWSEP